MDGTVATTNEETQK